MIIEDRAFGERYALRMEVNGYNVVERKGRDGWKNVQFFQDPNAAVGMIIRLRVIDEFSDQTMSFSDFNKVMNDMHTLVMSELQKAVDVNEDSGDQTSTTATSVAYAEESASPQVAEAPADLQQA